MEGRTLADLVKTFRFCAYQLSTIASNYKGRIACYDKKVQANIQALKKRVETAEEKSANLQVEVLRLEDKSSLLEVSLLNSKKNLINLRRI